MKEKKAISLQILKRYPFAVNLSLAVIGAFLFTLAHPNVLFTTGISVFGYIAIVPFFLLIKRASIKSSALWGAFSGGLSYFLFNFWIIFSYPIAIYAMIIYYALQYALLFIFFKIIDVTHKKYSFFFNAVAWTAFEYLKSLMFLGYPYGILGYTQWTNPIVIRSAAIFGVWGISFMLVLCSAIIAQIIFSLYNDENFYKLQKIYIKQIFIWLLLFLTILGYGVFSNTDYSNYKTKKIALIQPNSDPWIGNIEIYKQNYEVLRDLSENAISKNKNIDLIVWPETAFIPRIKWHYKYARDTSYVELVRDLLNFLNKQSVPFLIGNDDAVSVATDYSDPESGRIDYNAALLFIPKKNVNPPNPQTYRKMHLVPFTEHFPYKKLFPRIYKFLSENDAHFWQKGEEYTVFEMDGLKFSTPICFEDCFGYISANFVKNGANLIVNITNDAWANSIVSQNQHLSMAVFRAVENKVPVVRAASSGQTVYIDPNGKIVALLEPFTENFLITDVPLLTHEHKTVYSLTGDLFAKIVLIIAIVILTSSIFKLIFKKTDISKN